MENLRYYWVSSFLLFSFAVTCVEVNGTPEEDFAFKRFLDLGLQKYSNWLVTNNLDPTPLISHSVNLTLISRNYTQIGEIKNQRMYNHSTAHNWTLTATTENPDFSVSLYMPNYWAIGEYTVEGSVYEKPFNGSGKSTLTALGIPDWFPIPFVMVHISNFTLTPDGYVDLDSGESQKIFIADYKGEFENLNAGNDAAIVRYEMAARYIQQVRDWYPLLEYLVTYLKELFAQSTWAEIIKP